MHDTQPKKLRVLAGAGSLKGMAACEPLSAALCMKAGLVMMQSLATKVRHLPWLAAMLLQVFLWAGWCASWQSLLQ
jgi:hypothetical protein